MEFQHYWYILLLCTVAAATLFIVIKRPGIYFTELKYMLPAIVFSGAIFVILNIRFREFEIIYYNPDYLTGKNIFNLPIEEWLFLLVVSLFSFAIYLQVKIKFENFEKPKLFLTISLVLLVVFGLTAWFSRSKLVPFFVFFLLTIYFGYTIFRNRFAKYFSKFYVAYVIAVIPFFLMKGILYSLPVILYSNEHTLGIRLLSVPVEDFGFFFLLMLINISIFEYLRDHHIY